LDEARKKYCLKTNGYWKVDQKGEEIINMLTNKVKDIYLLKDPDDSIEIIMEKNKKFREFFDDRFKILDYANDSLILKNNIKALVE
jgi:hypothetical protein